MQVLEDVTTKESEILKDLVKEGLKSGITSFELKKLPKCGIIDNEKINLGEEIR